MMIKSNSDNLDFERNIIKFKSFHKDLLNLWNTMEIHYEDIVYALDRCDKEWLHHLKSLKC